MDELHTASDFLFHLPSYSDNVRNSRTVNKVKDLKIPNSTSLSYILRTYLFNNPYVEAHLIINPYLINFYIDEME